MKSNDYLKALSFAKEWAVNKMRPFISEDIRRDFERLNPGTQFTNWGDVMNSLSYDGLIIENGYVRSTGEKAKNPISFLVAKPNKRNARANNLEVYFDHVKGNLPTEHPDVDPEFADRSKTVRIHSKNEGWESTGDYCFKSHRWICDKLKPDCQEFYWTYI